MRLALQTWRNLMIGETAVACALFIACSGGGTGKGATAGGPSMNGDSSPGGASGVGGTNGNAGGVANVAGSSGVTSSGGAAGSGGDPNETTHVWDVVEISLTATGKYENPYTDVEVWVELKGPGFAKKVWGFWDGDNAADPTFRVRFVATAPGDWTWTSGSSQAADTGLNGKTGTFNAVGWTDAEKQANPNRHGFVTASKSGHALSYADGTPFFLLADTEWSAFTSRVPFKGINPPLDFKADPNQFGFEGEVQALKKLGFNSIAVIATSPNWNDDSSPLTVNDSAGVTIRSCKPKSNSMVCRDMRDEAGNRPFSFPGKCAGLTSVCADYDRINPAYFRSVDKKMAYLAAEGFVPYVETVRRDHGPIWLKYHDFSQSFPRFLNYMKARYGAYNLIYSLAHIDAGTDVPYPTWRAAMNAYYQHYGDMPFGQIVTVMAAASTFTNFGHTTDNPWLKAHAVGNTPKDHGMEQNLATCFQQTPAIPGFANEPHYVGFPVDFNFPVGEPILANNSERDNYFARAHAFGIVLNGGLAGHITGTGSRWDNTAAEPANDPNYPPPWVTLDYTFTSQARHLAEFMLSEGTQYQDLLLASTELSAAKPAAFPVASLEGWSHLMRTADKRLALAYFESKAPAQSISNLLASTAYQAQWFDPRTGQWSNAGTGTLTSDTSGKLVLPAYPTAADGAAAPTDWALKLTTP